MAVYTPHTLVTFGGTLNTTAPDHEIWQCGVRVTAAGGGALADHDAYLAAIQPGLSAWFALADVLAAFPSNATLNWIKANAINAAGHYRDPTTHVFDYPAAVPGADTPNLVDIICVAISWGTALAIRKGVYATHGRIYPPSYHLAPASDSQGAMRTQAGNSAAWVQRGVGLLTILANAGEAIPVVCSPHAGEIQPITHVRVGDVLDVQRRRKSALKEVYASAVFP